MLDEAGMTCASELMAMVSEKLDELHEVDTDTLHTVAAYYWARSLAQGEAVLSAADLRTAMHVFGMLYLADHRRVPRELWSRLTEETGHDPWRDPVDHASDLVLDVEQGGDPALLDEAVALLRSSAPSPYRDTTLGLALCRRAPVSGRLDDADSGIRLLAHVAALPEYSQTRRARRRLTLAEAYTRRFVVSADLADLAAAESAARSAFAEAPEGSSEQADSAGTIGLCLARRGEAALFPDGIAGLQEAVSWLRLGVDLRTAAGQEPDRANLRKAMGLLLERMARDFAEEPGREGEEEREEALPEVGVSSASSDSTSQARHLAELGSKTISRIVSEAEAIRQAVDPAFALSEDAIAPSWQEPCTSSNPERLGTRCPCSLSRWRLHPFVGGGGSGAPGGGRPTPMSRPRG
ncbi:hypothetical protein [Streptomyces sp. enrichment culture]|uniref:hypothetical protein n=1 Tax=Streptomyces sp. enrichment culture TaxID=1795815 RepID=UPI003F560B87